MDRPTATETSVSLFWHVEARLISCAPQFESFAQELVDWARKSGEKMPESLADLAHQAQDILSVVSESDG